MHLDLSDEEAAALTKELAEITGNDRYPFWEPIRALIAEQGPEKVAVVLQGKLDADDVVVKPGIIVQVKAVKGAAAPPAK